MSQSLPEHPDLGQLRRQAKELRDSARAGDAAALDRIARSVAPHDAAAVRLATAQLTIAREHGFPSWPGLKAAVEAQAGGGSPHLAALLTASVTGWTPQAERLLADDPRIGRASVFAAAALGEARLVSEFIAADPAAAAVPDHDRGWPPLLYACYSHWHRIDPARVSGLVTVVGLLLDAGASPDTSNGRPAHQGRRSALHGAVIADNPDVTRLLLDRGARPGEFDCLYQAATHPDNACLELLLRHGAPVASTWAMESAVRGRNTAGLRLLLAAAARNRSRWGETALHTAAGAGRAETVWYLLGLGADANARDERFSATPLAYATVGSGEGAGQDGDWPATVRLLLDACASREGAWIAARPPSSEVAEVLREYGVQPEGHG